MSTEHIDPEVIEAAVDAFEKAPEYPGEGPGTTDRDAMEVAICAADEKRRELAQLDAEGQEYVYRMCWMRELGAAVIATGPIGEKESIIRSDAYNSVGLIAWVERALLGDWERVS